jgi:hypothetical protein
MYDCGARTLLVMGNSPLAATLRTANLFDLLQIEVVRLAPAAGAATVPIADGFALVEVRATLGAAICVFARTAGARGGR